ncbi:MAG: ParB N-terminal domain-containing protein [Chloroflexota bacterium]
MMAKKPHVNKDQLDQFSDFDFGTPWTDNAEDTEWTKIAPVYLQPNPHNPRLILPYAISRAFFAGEITAKVAMGEFIQVVFRQAKLAGRVYRAVSDLLNLVESNEEDKQVELSVHEQQLLELLQLAQTIQQNGLINPLIVIEMSDDMHSTYRIVAGNRRYWAIVLLRHFIPNTDDLLDVIPCRVISDDTTVVWQQAVENTARADLNAVATACQLAILLFEANEHTIPEGLISYDFYRKAFNLDLRSHHAQQYKKRIYSAMGGIKRARFSQIKSLLKLTPSALQYGNEQNTPSTILEKLCQLNDEEQKTIVADAIRNHWNHNRLLEEINYYEKQNLANDEGDKTATDDRHERSFANRIRRVLLLNPEKVAANLENIEGSITAARARIVDLRQMLEKIEQALSQPKDSR